MLQPCQLSNDCSTHQRAQLRASGSSAISLPASTNDTLIDRYISHVFLCRINS